jgi:DNA-binding LacI/PurR family transcriptional regulator
VPEGLDAVVAPDDLWAAQILKTLLHRGRNVPAHVAVAGFDNVAIARATPS